MKLNLRVVVTGYLKITKEIKFNTARVKNKFKQKPAVSILSGKSPSFIGAWFTPRSRISELIITNKNKSLTLTIT
jgi:hypothetical protein